ncbi:MAG TPA: RDD family protein [Thermoleophilaceae bacterium]|nr:RDD family protein [Thermoleophilaceae bacterium]
MDSGSSPPDRPGYGPGSPGYGPGGEPPPSGPQSPAPQPPRAPDDREPGEPPPAGPQSPGPQSPEPPPAGPQSPSPPGAPPYAPPATPGGPETPRAPSYGGPVPPGGWHAPPAPQASAPPGGPLAGWGTRAWAYIIDALVLLVPVAILFVVIVGGAIGITGTDDEDVATGAVILAVLGWLLVFAILSLLYAPLLMARKGAHNGQTWGKQLMGIRAVRDSGETWGFGSAAFREVLLKNLAVAVASSIIPIIPWFLNFFWPLWDDQNRALHDMAASSHVVKA